MYSGDDNHSAKPLFTLLPPWASPQILNFVRLFAFAGSDSHTPRPNLSPDSPISATICGTGFTVSVALSFKVIRAEAVPTRSPHILASQLPKRILYQNYILTLDKHQQFELFLKPDRRCTELSLWHSFCIFFMISS